MAKKIINMIPKGGAWDGEITVTIDNDAAASKVTVTAVMKIYETYGASPQYGSYNVYLYINKGNSTVASAGSKNSYVDFWLVDKEAGGYVLQCSKTISYTGSCKITVGGWSVAYTGALAGCSVDGIGEYEVKAANPSTINTDKSTVQMGKKLLISLSRASASYTHKLQYKIGSDSYVNIATGVATSKEWTVPDLASKCPNATSCSCTLKAITYNGKTKVGETTKSITLTVPDPTTPSIDGGEITLGTACKIACTRKSTNFTVELSFTFKEATVAIGKGKIREKNWTPSYDLASQIPNLTYGTGTLTCVTKNGTKEVGTKTATIKVNVPDNDTTRPVFDLNGLKLSVISNLADVFEGLYIRGKTGIKADFTASSPYSGIKSYKLTVGNQSDTGNPARIGTLVGEGTVNVTATVTDKRGYTKSVSTTIEVLPYRRPKIVPYSGYKDVICERAMETGELSSKGIYLAIMAGRSFTSIKIDGEEENGCILRYRWKENGATSFTSWTTLIAKDSTDKELKLIVGNVVSSLKKSYLVELEAKDTLGEAHSLTFQIMTEAISFVLYDGPDGAGFGKYPEAPHIVDIASHMTLRVRGKLEVVGATWESLGLAEGVKESTYSYGRLKDPGCCYLVSNGNHVYVAFNCAFTYTGSAVKINASAIPTEYRPKHWMCSLCILNDRAIASVSINTNGNIEIEWIQNLLDTVKTGSKEVTWVDGYIDYWI